MEKHSSVISAAAVALVDAVCEALPSISQEFKLLLLTGTVPHLTTLFLSNCLLLLRAAWKAGRKHSERTRTRRIVGRIVVEWLVDVLADPRKFTQVYEPYRTKSIIKTLY